jgi:hypothetical protein
MRVDNSRFFVIGAIGFLVGAFSGFFPYFWFFVLNRLHIGGISYQIEVFHTILRILLVLSLALGSFGCFALKRKYGSYMGLGCGVVFLALSMVLMYTLFLPPTIRWYVIAVYNPVWLLNVGLFFFGATLLVIRNSLPKPKSAVLIALIFFLIPVPTLTIFQGVILFWSFDYWLYYVGWLYGINSFVTAWFMLHLRVYPDHPTYDLQNNEI